MDPLTLAGFVFKFIVVCAILVLVLILVVQFARSKNPQPYAPQNPPYYVATPSQVGIAQAPEYRPDEESLLKAFQAMRGHFVARKDIARLKVLEQLLPGLLMPKLPSDTGGKTADAAPGAA